MADRPPNILICSCEDTMPLDAGAVQRGCRGADVTTARQLCRAELDKLRAAAAGGAPLVVGCTQEAPLFSEVAATARDVTYVNIRETAGWSKDAAAAGPRWRRCSPPRREPVPNSLRQLHQRRRDPDLRPRRARDRGGTPAQGPSRRHRADHAAGRAGAPAGHRISGGEGHDPRRQGPSRRLRAHRRRLRAAGALLARRARLRPGQATARSRAATSCSTFPAARRCSPPPTCATAICAPIPAIRAAVLARRAEGARPRRHLRQAALRHLHRRSLRAFPLQDRRLHAAASISARPARSRRPAIMSPSTRMSAPAAASAPPSARPAPPPMRCRRPTR